ncbi:hypothetical protein [Streptomyces sp. NPDC087862]|uniref:hypothetical protein n=1 Tax=Streptomyces sp. NPDC087862 TaxID=3365813 RepID=UPI0038168747
MPLTDLSLTDCPAYRPESAAPDGFDALRSSTLCEASAAEGMVSGPVFALVGTRLTGPPDNASVMRYTSGAAPCGPQSSRLLISRTEDASGRRNRTGKKSCGRTAQVAVPALDPGQGARVRVPVTVAAGASGRAALTATHRANGKRASGGATVTVTP